MDSFGLDYSWNFIGQSYTNKIYNSRYRKFAGKKGLNFEVIFGAMIVRV